MTEPEKKTRPDLSGEFRHTTCPYCGDPSGRGQYGYRTRTCGSEKCMNEDKQAASLKRRARLRPTAGRRLDWHPGLPKGDR